jgi:hypothetical protein
MMTRQLNNEERTTTICVCCATCVNRVGSIREKSKKSESDSFAPVGKTLIDSDSIPGRTIP